MKIAFNKFSKLIISLNFEKLKAIPKIMSEEETKLKTLWYLKITTVLSVISENFHCIEMANKYLLAQQKY